MREPALEIGYRQSHLEDFVFHIFIINMYHFTLKTSSKMLDIDV